MTGILFGCGANVSNVPSTRIPFDIIYRHIWAHQDNMMRYSELIREAQLNCQVDYLAKNVLWGLEG